MNKIFRQDSAMQKRVMQKQAMHKRAIQKQAMQKHAIQKHAIQKQAMQKPVQSLQIVKQLPQDKENVKCYDIFVLLTNDRFRKAAMFRWSAEQLMFLIIPVSAGTAAAEK